MVRPPPFAPEPPPADLAVYVLGTWRTYGAGGRAGRSHWLYRGTRGRLGWLSLCGLQALTFQPGAAVPPCVRCAKRYAKIAAQYDADHTTPGADVI